MTEIGHAFLQLYIRSRRLNVVIKTPKKTSKSVRRFLKPWGQNFFQIFYWISWRFTQIWVESKKKIFWKIFLSPQDFIYRRTLLDVFLSVFMTTVNRRPRLYSRKKAWPISVIFRWSITIQPYLCAGYIAATGRTNWLAMSTVIPAASLASSVLVPMNWPNWNQGLLPSLGLP